MTSNDDDALPPAADLPPESRDIDLEIDDDLRASYLSYAMSVIVSRALPDVRDGLKPSQRRILRRDERPQPASALQASSSARRSPATPPATITRTAKRSSTRRSFGSAQDWSMRYPLIDGQGNFGNIDG